MVSRALQKLSKARLKLKYICQDRHEFGLNLNARLDLNHVFNAS